MPANQQRRVTSYVKKDGTRVRSHTRSAHWARSRAAWAGAGFAGLSATAILVEFGFTLVSTVCVVLIAGLTAAAVLAGGYAERNKKKMARQQQRRRRTARTSRTSSNARRRTTSSRSRRR